MAMVEWKWKESLWGAGSVQIESICSPVGSHLKGFVLFWLSGSSDTSYINLCKTIKSWIKRWTGTADGWTEKFLKLYKAATSALVINHFVLELIDTVNFNHLCSNTGWWGNNMDKKMGQYYISSPVFIYI